MGQEQKTNTDVEDLRVRKSVKLSNLRHFSQVQFSKLSKRLELDWSMK